MDTPRKDFPYAASCNPPRRAKRPSTGGNPPTAEERANQPLPTLAPAIVPLSADIITPVDDDDFTTADVPQPKRRGRKPSSLSRAARESMRRQNHSRIEKARRTKINEALAMLRDLVPADAGRKPSAVDDDSADEDEDEDEFGSGSGKKHPANRGKQRQEKEFKLEILEKAVSYVQELQEKVHMLEVRGCVRCSNTDMAPTHPPKRKRDEISSSGDDHDPHFSMNVPVERPNKRLTVTQPVPLPMLSPSNTRLPSISSWLPKSVADSVLPESRTPPTNPIQLPTPPASAVIGPIMSPQVPPALRLELPMASLSTRNFSTPTKSASSSPSWTPEDESIASLLLRIKSSSSPKASRHGASVGDLLAPIPEAPNMSDPARFMGVDEMRVQTPGSLLGLTSGSKCSI
ncbi:hypothetical protein BJY52DRAFT_882838 [Lactarius psammicola]|nr:hypothetical protein BJY52DRAFT_882838 [Lactarius psammicola]